MNYPDDLYIMKKGSVRNRFNNAISDHQKT